MSETQIDVIYHIVASKTSGKDNEVLSYCRTELEYCKAQNIGYISMSNSLYTQEIASIISEYQVKACVFSYVHTDKIISSIQSGAAYVGSHYYDVEYMKRLTWNRLN